MILGIYTITGIKIRLKSGNQMQLLKIDAIHQNKHHNAFTDLIEYKGQYFCCFRQASNHISPDGFIQILVSNDLENWQKLPSIRRYLADLRDPKLSIHPDGKLLLTYYRKQYDTKSACIANENCIQFSQTGESWSQPRIYAQNNWWLWRHRWFNQTALGIAYNRAQNTVHLYQGDPLRQFHKIKDPLFSLDLNGKGYPNESDICFLADGTAICILRRDADSYSAQLGIAKPNYQQWQWFDLAEYIGGPNIIELTNGKIIIAGRRWTKTARLSTWIFELDLTDKKLIPLIELPSAGDNSYPAMLEKNANLYVSYYSQHENKKCSIYIAKLSLLSPSSLKL